MISDEERREVARRLREIEGRTTSELTDGELLDLLADKVRFGRYGSKNFDEVLLGRIADLIDRPTCSMEYRPGWSGDEIYPTRAYECSVCGHIVMDGKPDYCPRCGAEVVYE